MTQVWVQQCIECNSSETAGVSLMADSLAFRSAQTHVKCFSDESNIIEQSNQALECRDCEDFLQLGIDAFRWLNRADESIRLAVFAGYPHNEAADNALAALYKAWLDPCVPAERWIAIQEERGYHIDNLTEFRNCVAEVEALVRDSRHVGGELAKARDRAIASQKAGETDDWECPE